MAESAAEAAFKKGRASGAASARAKAKRARPRRRQKGAPYRHPHVAIKRQVGGFMSKHPILAAVTLLPAEVAVIGGVIDGLLETDPIRETVMVPVIDKIPFIGPFLTRIEREVDRAVTNLRLR